MSREALSALPADLTSRLLALLGLGFDFEIERHDFDAPRALRAVFGGEIPRVVQGVRDRRRTGLWSRP